MGCGFGDLFLNSSLSRDFDWNFIISESWHPRPTPTLANRPVMSSEKVCKEFLRQTKPRGLVWIHCVAPRHKLFNHTWFISFLPPGYHFGLVKLEVKSKTSSGVEFTAGGNTTTDGGKVV